MFKHERKDRGCARMAVKCAGTRTLLRPEAGNARDATMRALGTLTASRAARTRESKHEAKQRRQRSQPEAAKRIHARCQRKVERFASNLRLRNVTRRCQS